MPKYHQTKQNIVQLTVAREKRLKAKYPQTYKVWAGMIRRCTDAKDPYYANYGGRGVKVTKRWLDFQEFIRDMGNRPKHYWLTMKRSNGNYTPGNCVWISPAKLNQKRRRAAKRKARIELRKKLEASIVLENRKKGVRVASTQFVQRVLKR
jgi:hypothetical protein